MKEFSLVSDFVPAGDQPTAIAGLNEGLVDGLAYQTLLGVTGSGKTFSIANVIQEQQRPTMLLAPNKTLAAQLYFGTTRYDHCCQCFSDIWIGRPIQLSEDGIASG